jgi:hypothetical protein
VTKQMGRRAEAEFPYPGLRGSKFRNSLRALYGNPASVRLPTAHLNRTKSRTPMHKSALTKGIITEPPRPEGGQADGGE